MFRKASHTDFNCFKEYLLYGNFSHTHREYLGIDLPHSYADA